MKPHRPSEIDELTLPSVQELVKSVGGDPDSFDGRLITQLIQTSLKLIPDGHDTGQLKLLNSALKEMRYAYRVFNQYRGIPKITIFGSARTPPNHPDYLTAHAFSMAMAEQGWMAITGAGNGIMKAGHEGPKREASFGLSIRLPFETTANTVIEGDPKLINFRYFFTRKLMFMTHSDAVSIFPGGFGTQDELFECLTLVQTGKSNVIPIVMLEGEGGIYWKNWENYIRAHLLNNGWISPEDTGIYYIAPSVQDAVRHIQSFYRLYHSSRYVRDIMVLRLRQALNDEHVERLNEEFAGVVKEGRIEQVAAFDEEKDHRDLPRIAFVHTRHQFGRMRAMIDRINGFADDLPAPAPETASGKSALKQGSPADRIVSGSS